MKAALLLMTFLSLANAYDDKARLRNEAALKAVRAPYEEAARKLLSKDQDTHLDGFSLLVDSEEQAIRPLLGVPAKKLDPSAERAIIDVAESALGELIRDFRKRLLLDLEDKRLIPERTFPGPKPEEHRPPGRVCDWAYLTLRHLNVASRHESELDWEVGRNTFLEKSDASKDRLITQFKKTGKWVPIQFDPDTGLKSRD